MCVGETDLADGVLAGKACGCVVAAGPAVRFSLASGGEDAVAGIESGWSGHGVSIASVSMANPYPAPTAATSRNSTIEMVTKRIYQGQWE